MSGLIADGWTFSKSVGGFIIRFLSLTPEKTKEPICRTSEQFVRNAENHFGGDVVETSTQAGQRMEGRMNGKYGNFKTYQGFGN